MAAYCAAIRNKQSVTKFGGRKNYKLHLNHHEKGFMKFCGIHVLITLLP